MLQQLKSIVRAAGGIILSAKDAGVAIHEKSGYRDLVTQYDTAVEQFLRTRLLALLPEAGFMGEESFAAQDWTDYEWLFIVDPIDGTTNFIQGFANSCVSVALLHNGQPEYGLVYNPYVDELYWAQRGKGAYLERRDSGVPGVPQFAERSPLRGKSFPSGEAKRLACGDRDLAHSLLIFGSALYYPDEQALTLALFQTAYPLVQDVRRFGSAALDLCYIAAGRAGVFFEARLCPWDYAAGGLIAQEAGAVVTQLDGRPLALYEKGSVLVGAKTAHAALKALAAPLLPDAKR